LFFRNNLQPRNLPEEIKYHRLLLDGYYGEVKNRQNTKEYGLMSL
jgi:hypothetical protein